MAGNANSGKHKSRIFFEALMLEVKSRDDTRGLRAIAKNLLDVALDKDHKDWLPATKEVLDRVDGKVAQAIENGGDGVSQPFRIVISSDDASL